MGVAWFIECATEAAKSMAHTEAGNYTIAPDRSRAVQNWDVAICVALIYTALVTPAEVGFIHDRNKKTIQYYWAFFACTGWAGRFRAAVYEHEMVLSNAQLRAAALSNTGAALRLPRHPLLKGGRSQPHGGQPRGAGDTGVDMYNACISSQSQYSFINCKLKTIYFWERVL